MKWYQPFVRHGREKHLSLCFSQVYSATAVQGCAMKLLSFNCLLFLVQVSLSFPTSGSQGCLPGSVDAPLLMLSHGQSSPAVGNSVFWGLLLHISP